MMKRTSALLLLAAATFTGLPGAGLAAAEGLVVEGVPTSRGTPYDVNLEKAREGVTVTGKVFASSVTGGHRMYGRVRAELVDRSGEVIAVHYADPRRLGTGRHTHRARFTIEIDRMPEAASLIRVAYR
jgi:hypothetical protein